MNHKLCITIIALLILTILIGINYHFAQIDKKLGIENQREEDRLKIYTEFTQNYNDLYASYNELYAKYEELAAENGFYQGWEYYEVTAYTSLDDGCDDIAATGININQLSKYYNFCAVDNSLIPYGSVVLVKFDTGIEGFLVVDCGDAIVGKHIDLYFVNDLNNAFEFGSRDLEIKIIKSKEY